MNKEIWGRQIRLDGLRGVLATIVVGLWMLVTVSPALAQPISVSQVLERYRDGGALFSEEVARLVFFDLDNIEAFCRATLTARPAQRAGVAAGFVESVAQLRRTDVARAQEAERRIRGCCGLIVDGDPDIRIQIGVELALSARRLVERHAEAAEHLNSLVDTCSDEIVATAYQVALGSDRIGLLLGSDVEATQNLGNIQDALSGGDFGGLVSVN